MMNLIGIVVVGHGGDCVILMGAFDHYGIQVHRLRGVGIRRPADQIIALSAHQPITALIIIDTQGLDKMGGA